MRVLLVQCRPQDADPEANLERLESLLTAHPEAELAVFPELYLSGYDPERAAELAVGVDSPAIARARAAAAHSAVALVLGFAERRPEGAVANAAACIDGDGSLAGVYRKTHLFGPRERDAFVAGDELLVVELAGCRVAPLICFDAEFPEPARAVARAGAELLVTIAANMAPYGPDHALAVRARALDNRRTHIYVNQFGQVGELELVGGSCVVAPDGTVTVLAQAGDHVLAADVPCAGAEPGAEVDYLGHVRDDLPVSVRIAETIADRGA